MLRKIDSFEQYKTEYKTSVENPEKFWEEKAEQFEWHRKWANVVSCNFNEAETRWFENGKLNITENALDRHLTTQANKPAIIWEPNNPSDQHKTFTYKEVHSEVCKIANGLRNLGVKKGDRVCLYMPMVPELAFATLACARIGAIHSVVFAGFSAKALADRINDCSCKIILTADGAFRGSKTIELKKIVDTALNHCEVVERTVVLNRCGIPVQLKEGRDLWWEQIFDNQSAEFTAESMDSEDPLFILYTSGSTGKPKGVQHSSGGYMVYAEYSFRNVFQYEEDDIYWCTADIGWITGHSYIIYGPLLAGATTVMFEGVPTFPNAGRFWEICEKHKINLFYTAPTAIRALQAYSTDFVNRHNLSSLKVLGSVGEPINEEAWHWYHKNIGKEKCPIVDTWWQTETGGILISPLAGITPLKPGYASLPLPGIQPVIVDSLGNELTENEVEGNLCIKRPWPSMLRSTWGDHERCKSTYFKTYPGMYFTGDGCNRDINGYYRITGRVDDVINVSGHRFGTAEIENAINEHPDVIESAVIGFPHDIKGQGIYAFVITQPGETGSNDLFSKEIIEKVVEFIGPIAKPDKIQFVSGLPKTRSGKIMRRILRKLAKGNHHDLGDTSTLLDPNVIDSIKLGILIEA